MIYTITCHRAYNYGAVLQTYALQTFLKENGYKVKTIDYYPPYLRKISAKYKNNIIAILGRKILYFPDYAKSKKVFGDFIAEKIDLTAKCVSIEDIKKIPRANLYIVGSDQVWNPIMGNGLDDCYYLNDSFFIEKKISYAASIGIKDFSDYYSHIFRQLQKFDFITVREKQTKETLKKIGIKSEVVMDPAYLLSREEWNELCKDSFKRKERYVLVYALHHIQFVYDYAKRLASKMNCKVYVVSVELKEKKRGADKFFWNVPVKKFVSLFSQADAIVTNSFHGVAFANIFNKPVHIFDTEKNDVRLEDIIVRLHLGNRVCEEEKNEILDNVVCNESLEIMKEEIDNSKKILLSFVKSYE